MYELIYTSCGRRPDPAAPDAERGEVVPLAAARGGRVPVKLTVNGADVEVDDRHANSPLLWVLRDALGMRGTKFG
jgi:hypothetical protein